jgi:hypothetical protein
MLRELIWLGLCLIIIGPAVADHYTMKIGSKSDPEAHLFSYDQKFRESTYLNNYMINMSASKEFTDATRLTTSMALMAYPEFTDMAINADFIGIGRIGYLVLDPETGKPKNEMSRISHMFVGNFTLDEHIRVAKNHLDEEDYPCSGSCPA